MDIGEFFKWILSSGGSIIAASWILDRFTFFQKFTADQKEWTFFGLSAAISVGAYLGVTYIPVQYITAATPYFLMISGTFLTVIVSKKFHQIDKADSPMIAKVTATANKEVAKDVAEKLVEENQG
jgi:drug/metabolite transporter (DMT)-like permease